MAGKLQASARQVVVSLSEGCKQFFYVLGFVFAADEYVVGGFHDDCVVDAEYGDWFAGGTDHNVV